MVLEKSDMNIQSILWIFLKIYSLVFPNILCIFFIFVGIFCGTWTSESVKSCSLSATIYELGARLMLPLDGAAPFSSIHTAWNCPPSL
jgi:hypothetical protein